MISRDQVLPSLYELQRGGVIGEIHVCARSKSTVARLAADEGLLAAFPDSGFTAHPAADAAEDVYPEGYRQVLADLPEGSVVYVAIPDQEHYAVVNEALDRGHHVVCVKPLTLTYAEAEELRAKAKEKGLFVGVEYHKRYDDRSRIARRKYRAGELGEFKLGQARLHEPWWYRDSNFMNWCTTENSDFFTYIGCHYVDFTAFVTGLKPVSVSLHGIEDAYPNGNVGYLYTDARIVWENGAVLNVQNGIAYPNEAAGANDQGITLFTKDEASGRGGFLAHVDCDRGVSYCAVTDGDGAGKTSHHVVNPDYFQMLDREGGEGLRPVGYGYRAVQELVETALRVAGCASLEERRAAIEKIDEEGLHATPANSSFNELVVEAGRMSLLNGARTVLITYGENAGVAFAE